MLVGRLGRSGWGGDEVAPGVLWGNVFFFFAVGIEVGMDVGQ